LKAAVINGPGEIKVIDKPIPRPGRGEVLVKVKYCGICGTDLHAFSTGFFPPGVTIGHEFSGVVAGAGQGCEDWSAGERVTGNNNTPCGSCATCLEGNDNLCPEMRRLGIADNGALAEYLVVPAVSLYRLPDSAPLDAAALAEPVSVALHAVYLSGCRPEQKVLVIGAGTIGLIVLTLLKQRGLKEIAVVEPNQKRAAIAAAMGAAMVIDPRAGRLNSEVDRFSSGRGANLVFECAGIPETISDACSLAGAKGSVIALGICHQPVEISFLSLVTREISIIPAFSKKAAEFKEAVDLIAGARIDLSPLISQVISLDDVEEGFKNYRPENIKVLVAP
jgi:2-desacetyl-2-hydroxyethyl bacteriochlorophyllide A dehydrogenase